MISRRRPQAVRNVLPDLTILLAAAMYFVLLWPGVRLLSRLEHRMIASR